MVIDKTFFCSLPPIPWSHSPAWLASCVCRGESRGSAVLQPPLFTFSGSGAGPFPAGSVGTARAGFRTPALLLLQKAQEGSSCLCLNPAHSSVAEGAPKEKPTQLLPPFWAVGETGDTIVTIIEKNVVHVFCLKKILFELFLRCLNGKQIIINCA